MDGIWLLHLLKYANIIIHVGAIWFVARQLYHSTITVWIWREGWICILCSMIIILFYRIADLYGESTSWRLILAGPMTFFFLLGFMRLARLVREKHDEEHE